MIEMLQRHSSFRQSTMIYHRPHRGIFCTLAVCAALINSVISYHTTTVRSVDSVNNGQLVIPLPISQASAEEVVAAIQTHEIQQQLHKEQHNEFVGNHRTVRFAEEPDRHQRPIQHDIQQTPTPNEALQAPLPPQKSDLHPEAQTLYDIRGFHSPLTQPSNQAQRHHFQNNFHQPPHLQQQQQQHQHQQQQEQHQQQPQQQQQNFLAPTSFRYFQDDNRNQQEHRVEPHQGHSPTPSPFHNSPLIVPSFFQPPAVFNNHQHAQPQQSQQQLYHQPQHSQENDFRPSQIDPSLNSVPAIQSTTESPVGFSPLHSTTQVPRSSQSKAYSSTVKPGSFVYVYEDVDYGDDLGNQNQNAQDNRLLQDSYLQSRDQERPSQIKTNQVTALIVDKPRLNGQRGINSDHRQYNYQEEEEPNIAFEPVRKDYNQLDNGRHHDNTFQNIFVPSFHSGPNVEIVPSSERKPPPDQSNAIPPVLAKPPVFKEPEKYPFTNDDYVLKSNPKQPEYIDVVESFEPYRPVIYEEPRETTTPHHHNSRRKNQHHTRRPTHREPPTRPPQSTLVPYTTLRTTTYSTTTRPTRKHVTKTPSPFDSHNNYDDAAEQELIQKALQPAGTSDSKNDYHPVVLPAFPSQASRGVKPAGHRATTHREETTPFSRIPFTPPDDLSTTHEDDYEIFTSASPVVTKTFGRIKDFQNFDDVTPSTTPFSVRAGFNITPAQTFSDEQPVSVATPTRSRLPPFRPSFPVTTTTSTTSTTTSTAVPRINQKLGGAFRRKGPRPTKSTTRAPQIINEDSRQDLASVITPRLHSRPAIRVPTQPPTAIVEYHGNNEEDDRISVRNRGSHRENIIYSIDNDLEESPPVQRRPERVNSGSRINSRPRNHEAEGPRPKSHRPRHRNENTAGRNQQEPKSGKPLYYAGKMLQKEGGVYAGYKIPRYHVYGAPIPLIPGDLPFDHQPTKNGRKTVANTNVELPPLLPTTTREPEPSEDVSNQAETPSRRGNTIKKLRIFTTDNDAPQKHERLHFRHQEDTNDPEEDTIPPTTRSRLAGKRKRPTVAAKIIEITTTNAPSERFVQPSTTERTHVRIALREDKNPKLEIEKPTAPPRRVHIRRRPNVRSFQKPKPSSPTTSTTNEPSIVASKPSPPRRLKPRQKSHRLRLHPSPPTESHTDDKQEEDQRETSVSEVTREYTPPPTETHSSVKPTEVPEKFSSRYREETAPFAVTRLPTITSRPRSSFTKPRTSRRPTSAPKTTTTPPAEDNIPPSVRLRPEDVIVKRKPARIIPPDSVSLRLKKKRNQLIGSRKKLSFSPSQSSESHEDDVGNSQKREVAGVFSDDNQTVRKEHRYQNFNKEKDIDSQETATILGLTTSERPQTTSTDWALDSFKPEYGTRAAISATLTTSLQDGDTTSEDSDQTKEGYDSTSTRAPAFRLGAGHLDPFSASYQPLSILSTDTQMPSLPLESIFPVLTNSTRG